MPRSIDLRAAVWSGVIAGLVFIILDLTLVPLFGLGTPWEVVRMIAAIVLGPEALPPPASFDLRLFMVAMALHFSLSTLYAVIRAWIVEGWLRRLPALLQGGFGLVIYLINFYGLTELFPWFADARSWVSLLVHISWAIVLPVAYRELTGRAPETGEPGSGTGFPMTNPNPVLEADPDGRIVFANPAAEQLVRALDLGSVRDLLPERHEAIVRRILGSGGDAQDAEAGVRGRVLLWAYRRAGTAEGVRLYGTDLTGLGRTGGTPGGGPGGEAPSGRSPR